MSGVKGELYNEIDECKDGGSGALKRPPCMV